MAFGGNLMRNPFKLFPVAAVGVGLCWCVYAYSQRRPAASPARTQERLAHTVVSLESGTATISEEFSTLEVQSGATFIVRWEALADCGLLPGTRLSIRAQRTSAERALSALIGPDSDPRHDLIKLDYFIDDQGRVVITSGLDAIESSATLRLYDVSDLLRAAPSRAEAAVVIEKIITEHADMGAWKDFGGTVGTFSVCGNKLCIVQSQHGHAMVVRMLEMMREEVSQTGKLPKFVEAPVFGMP